MRLIAQYRMRLMTQNYRTTYIANHTRKELMEFKFRWPSPNDGLFVIIASYLPCMNDMRENYLSLYNNSNWDKNDNITNYNDTHNFNLKEYQDNGYVLK